MLNDSGVLAEMASIRENELMPFFLDWHVVPCYI
jgi:hypothetical protein